MSPDTSETIPLPENGAKVRAAQIHVPIAKIPNPFDPAQNPNYGPRLSFATREDPAVLNSIKAFIRRFVSLSESQAQVVAVWVVHTHVIEAAHATPYLAITSAEKQSGKSTILEVLELLVAKPWSTGRVTAAVLIRKIDAERPTLLLDESDAAFGGEKEYAEALRGLLNTGHKPSGKASCCVGQGANISYKDFSTFCAKAIAGIGRLPDTIADRAIPIRLKRAKRGECIKFRSHKVEPEATSLRGTIEAWCQVILPQLHDAEPNLPDELTARQQDSAEPLLAIADLAGGDWPHALRSALSELCTKAQTSDGSIGVQLLADIRQIFDARGIDRISSTELAAALCEIETSPWSEWSKGKPLSAGKLARLLVPFDVAPHNVRVGSAVLRGYETDDFQDAWSRYLPPACAQDASESATAATSSLFNEIGLKKSATEKSPVAVQNTRKPASNGPCSGVALLKPPMGGDGYSPAAQGPGCTCHCGSHFGTVAGQRAHVLRGRCAAASNGKGSPTEAAPCQ